MCAFKASWLALVTWHPGTGHLSRCRDALDVPAPAISSTLAGKVQRNFQEQRFKTGASSNWKVTRISWRSVRKIKCGQWRIKIIWRRRLILGCSVSGRWLRSRTRPLLSLKDCCFWCQTCQPPPPRQTSFRLEFERKIISFTIGLFNIWSQHDITIIEKWPGWPWWLSGVWPGLPEKFEGGAEGRAQVRLRQRQVRQRIRDVFQNQGEISNLDKNHVKHCCNCQSEHRLGRIFGRHNRAHWRNLWLGTGQTGDRLHWTKPWWNWRTTVPKLSRHQRKSLLWEKMQCRGWEVFNISVRKSFPITQQAHPRPDDHDLCLSTKSCLWVLTYDKWRITSIPVWHCDVKISSWLFPKHCLRQRLQVQRIWTQQGDPAVHGIANNGGQVSPVQSHFVRRKFQVFRVCIS